MKTNTVKRQQFVFTVCYCYNPHYTSIEHLFFAQALIRFKVLLLPVGYLIRPTVPCGNIGWRLIGQETTLG